MLWKNSSVFILLFSLVVLQLSCNETRKPETPVRTYQDPHALPQDALPVDIEGIHGGRVVTATFSEVSTFHPLLYSDTDSQTYNQLMHPGLTRLNPLTQEPEPALAKSWEASPDFTIWKFHLREGLRWSDGTAFTADDVLFTMQIVGDPRVASGAHDALSVEGKPVVWKKLNEFTVQAELPSLLVTFLRHLDSGTCPILAKHKWEKSYRDGKIAEVMQTSTPPSEMPSLGPFRLKEYKPGERLVLARNPYYWKKDKGGRRLPYLDEIVFLILGGQDQVQIKLESGELDTYPSIRPADVDRFREKAPALRLKVENVGPSYDFEGLFFNQNGDRNPKTGKPYVESVKFFWFTDVNFRKAMSHAIQREELVRVAGFGKAIAAYGCESPSNKKWQNPYIPRSEYDPGLAISLLGKSGFRQKALPDGTLALFDRKGNRVRFSLHTNAGNTIREKECLMIAGDLGKLGIQVDYTALDYNTLVSKVDSTFDFDAILLGLSHDDPDPSSGLSVFLSSGFLHFWWPGQKSPRTAWEKQIDDLMNQTMSTFDDAQRKQSYDQVQKILAEQQPMIFTIHQLIHITARENLGNLKPALSRHRTLWNADELYWKNAM